MEIAQTLSESAQVDGISDAALRQAETYIKELEAEQKALKEASRIASDTAVKLAIDLTDAKKLIRNLRAKVTRLSSDKPKKSRIANKPLVLELKARESEILAAIQAKYGEAVLEMVAWHGSPHKFDKFDISKIGTGEGNQVYGHGLYFAGAESVANYYKNALAPRMRGQFRTEFSDDASIDEVIQMEQDGKLSPQLGKLVKALNANDWLGFNYPAQAIDNVFYKNFIQKFDPSPELIEAAKVGAKYRVDLKPEQDEYLLWDKPLSEQSEKVRKALAPASDVQKEYNFIDKQLDRLGDKGERNGPKWNELVDQAIKLRKKYPGLTLQDEWQGSGIYQKFSQGRKGGQAKASDYFKSLGIRGIKYLDGTSRGKGEGSYNYVLFDDADVSIEEMLEMAVSESVPTELVDWATLTLGQNIGNTTVGQFKNALNQLTNGQLDVNTINEIHAEAIENLKGDKTVTPEQRAASKNRGEHYRTANKFRNDQISAFAKSLAKVPDKLTTNIIKEGINGEHTDQAIYFALARKTFPKLEKVRIVAIA